MKRKSTIMVWIAVVLFAGAYLFPLWTITLSAPQYPEGLGMHIWVSKVTGVEKYDLQNINGLNHYIGMREIHAESIPELRFMKFIVAGMMALAAITALVRRRWMLWVFVIVCVVVSIIGLADFWRWTYDYGHNLDPEAPIKVPGMSYQPPIFGAKKLLNIMATSYPGLGGIAMMLGVGLSVVALALEVFRRKTPRASKGGTGKHAAVTTAAAAAIAIVLASGCSRGPEPIRFGIDNCEFCRMTITDERYGAEVVTRKGRVYKYDSVECLVEHLATDGPKQNLLSYTLVIDYDEPGRLVGVDEASFVHSTALRSPMGMNLTAFATAATGADAVRAHGGVLLTWDGARSLVVGERVNRGVQ